MRTYTREQVAQVVESIKSEETWLPSFNAGADEVLRRLDALPEVHPWPEPPLPPQPIHSAQPDGTFVPPLPAAPESPTTARCACCLRPEGHNPGCPFGQRPRATTPTPEVPALKAEVLMGPPHVCGENDDTCPDCYRPGLEPEPAAPEVVWTGDGVRVLADGRCVATRNLFGWTGYTWGVVQSMARALAESKREAQTLREETDTARQRTGLRAIDAENARMEGDQSARKAAESMRERAAKVLESRAKQLDAEAHGAGGDTVKQWRLAAAEARICADAIRALPLEKP